MQSFFKRFSAYLKINLAIIAITPFAAVFFNFYRYWWSLLLTIISAGLFFVLWDAYFTYKNVWSFNPQKVHRFRLLFLPLEEWLFFLTVPFSMLFTFFVLKTYFPQRLKISVIVLFLPGIFLLLIAFCFWKRIYTRIVFLLTVISFILFFLFFQAVTLLSFWLALGVGFAAFLIFNGLLTGKQIVLYNPRQIIGLRIGPIPLEDFFYNLTMLGWNFCLFTYFARL